MLTCQKWNVVIKKLRTAALKSFNGFILFVMLLSNFTGVSSAKAANESSSPAKENEQSKYQAPVFEHTKARIGTYSYDNKNQETNSLNFNDIATQDVTLTPDTAPESINLALNKVASQSSVSWWGGTAEKAVDGNTDGNWGSGSITHTDADAQAWWKVDLGQIYVITSIEIWNRTDCCSDRLSNFKVYISDDDTNWTEIFYNPGQAGVQTVFTVIQTGRYVKVQLLGTNYLNLAEVKIWGGVASSSSQITANPASVPADGQTQSTITVTAYDEYNNPISDAYVVLQSTGSAVITQPASPTNSQGKTTGYATNTTVESVMVSATVNGFVIQNKASLTFTAGLASAQKSTITANAGTALNNGTTPVTITVTALDDYNNPIANAAVVVATTGSAVVAQPLLSTDAQGKAVTTITDTVMENVTVSATIDELPIQQTVNLRFNCFAENDLVIENGDTCSFAAGTYTYNSITVKTGGTLNLQGNTSSGQGLTLNVDSLTVEGDGPGGQADDGKITADGQGYAAATGDGKGTNGTGPYNQAGGAGYGGTGGNGYGEYAGGSGYGDVYAPITLGSGGGTTGTAYAVLGGAGGGAIRLIVANQLAVNGSISSNGLSGEGNTWHGGGGGSGGSIWITADEITGNGTIKADGGIGGSSAFYGSGGGGAGGRIAIYTDSLSPTIQLFARGGSGYQKGGDGTIYLDGLDPTLSTLTVSPASVIADGTNTITITVTLKNADGILVPNRAVELALISGSGLSINNQTAGIDQYISIGNTNASGVATATLKTTVAGARTLKARSGQELIVQQGTVNFVPGPISLTDSLVTVSPASASANGQTQLTVTVTVYDANNNPIAGANVTLHTTGSATITQPLTPTNNLGKATGKITNTVEESVTITASVDETLLTDTAQAAFVGADLKVSQSATAQINQGSSSTRALLGFPITYTITVKNQGLANATGVTVTDSLPANVTFVSQTSAYSYQVVDNIVTWDVGDLTPGETVVFEMTAQIGGAAPRQITNTASGTTTTAEQNTANNQAVVTTSVELPAPQLEINPTSPTLEVQQGESVSINVKIRNGGAAPLTGITVEAPPHITWLSIDTNGLGQLAPGAETIITLTADAAATQTLGYYSDWIKVSEAGGTSKLIIPTIHVAGSTRPVSVTINNDLGSFVTAAKLNLRKQEASVIVSQGSERSYYPTSLATSDSNGIAAFATLESGAYDYQLTAEGHITRTGAFTILEGSGTQTMTLTLTAKPLMSISPNAPTLGVNPGGIQSQDITVINNGAATLSGLAIELPANLSWVYLGAPSPLPELGAGESMTFTLFASPPITQAVGVYQGYLIVTANGGLETQVALTVNVATSGTRDVTVNILDEGGQPITKGTATLISDEMATFQKPNGETVQYQPHFTQQLDANGNASFSGLEPGSYSSLISADGYTPADETIDVQSGSGVQQAHAILQTDPFHYSWEVTPIDGEYDITLTLTYDANAPALAIPPINQLNTCGVESGDTTTFSIVIYNPTDFPLYPDAIHVTLPGANIIHTDPLPAEIAPHTSVTIEVVVEKTENIGMGLITVDFHYMAPADDSVTYTLNPSSVTLQPDYGNNYAQTYDITPLNYTPGAQYSLEITQPEEMTWFDVISTASELPAGSEFQIVLTGNLPSDLENGVYTDRAVVLLKGSDGGARENYLNIRVTKTDTGTEVYTNLELGPLAYYAEKTGQARGYITTGCGGLPQQWHWESYNGTATAHTSHLFFPHPVQDTRQLARLEISQNIMLEGEGFDAALNMENLTPSALDVSSVEMIIRDKNQNDVTESFTIMPEAPTDIGEIAPYGSTTGSWTIVPSGLGITSPDGENYTVQAIMHYDWGGTAYSLNTDPYQITVYPSPDLVITYEIPYPDNVCTQFDMKTTIDNQGAGPARNLRFSSAQPRLAGATTPAPIGFAITGVYVDGVYKGKDLNVSLGNLPVGEQVEVTWHLVSSAPGRFVEFTSDYKQANYQGVLLPPLISEINTFLKPGHCTAADAISSLSTMFDGNDCPICIAKAQAKGGDPINTKSGAFSAIISDLSFPTSGGELSFQRGYSSAATGIYTHDLGYGWTFNHDTRLIFPNDPGGKTGYVIFQSATGNQFLLTINKDGSYTSSPGMNTTLTKSATGYLLRNSLQHTYRFNLNGRLLEHADEQGRAIIYTYNAQDKLIKVSADSGAHFIQIGYDAQGRIVSASDYAGRNTTYTYNSAGDLISSVDVLGQTSTYVYDSAHHMTQMKDPSGAQILKVEYDLQGRAFKEFDGNDKLLVNIVYNADGTSVLYNALGQAEIHTYDNRNTVTETTNALGASASTAYDFNFHPATITDAGGDTTTLTWSADGANLTKVVDADGNETAITYDALNNPTSVVDAGGFLTTFVYDGKLLKSTTDALNQTTSYTYTPEGYLASVKDALNQTTSYTYDSYGQRISMTDPQNHTWTYSYDSLGRLINSSDPLNRTAHNEYDAAGRLTRSVQNYDLNRPQNDDNLWNIVTEYTYNARGEQVSVTDTLGRTTQYEYDNAGRLVKSTDPAGNATTSTYDNAGQLIATIDALGRATSYEYDAAGRLIKTTDSLGNITLTAYNSDGTVASTTDALGRATSYTYDSLKRVITVTQPDGGATHNTYDDLGNLITTTDALGNSTHYTYDALGRQIKTTDALGKFTENFYNAAGQLIQTKDAKGNATTYAYDAAGRQISVTDALGNVTSYEYDLLGRRISVTDALGNKSAYTYDELNRTVAVTDALGHTTTTSYDALGQTLARTDPNNQSVSFSYDNLGRLISQTDALNHSASFTYDIVGNRLTATDANGHTSSTVYDALNRPISFTDANGIGGANGYDAAGNLITSTDGLGNATVTTYNALNQPIVSKDALGNETTQSYNLRGELVATTDSEGLTTGYEYDALGRLTTVIENYKPGFQPTAEINVRTEYTYDENGNRTSIKDGNGNISNFTYDVLNRLSTESDPLGNTWRYAYDALGNRISMTDANGATTPYTYDDANRLTDIVYGPSSTVHFTYDNGGRRTSMTDSAGTTSWTYNPVNQVTAVTDPFNKTVRYDYDPSGNRTALTYPNNTQVNYAYDPGNRLSSVISGQSAVISYQYDAANRLTNITRPNNVNTAYIYDDASRVTSIQHTAGTESLSSFQYTYDKVGNRKQAIETMGSGPDAGPTVTISVTDTTGVPLAGKTVYAFNGSVYTNYNKITDASGKAVITLPEGSYRFRVDVDGTQFWSGAENHCTIAGCTSVIMTIPEPVLVDVKDSDGTAMAGLKVYAFNGTTYTNYNGTTNANGQLSLRLPEGNYRFRADYNGTQFWSDSQNHCTTPGCTLASVRVTAPVTVAVKGTDGSPQQGIKVYAFNGTTYTNYNGTTDADGQVALTLPQGSYRFRADFNGTEFWSGATNHCDVPGCTSANVIVTSGVTVTVQDTNGAAKAGVKVYAFNGTTYTNYNGTTDTNGQVTFTLPQGDYRFRADFNGTQFWSGAQNHCSVPDCASATVTVTNGVLVTVQDTDGTAKSGIKVYAFNGATYTNYNGTTNASGQVTFTLPQGSYRFRADLNGTQFWSDTQNHCTVLGCGSVTVTVTKPLAVTVQDTDGAPKAGLKVYAFNGATYTNFNGTTDATGQVNFTLPLGSYRFRADLNGTQFWSGAANHCTLPGCESAAVTVSKPLTVAIQDGGGAPKSSVKVYAFNGATYTSFNATSNASGQAVFTLPLGSYRFRADYSGLQYWSGSSNHCAISGCESLTMIVGPQPTATATSIPTQTASATPTATSTPEPTMTPTESATPAPSDTPEPTVTPSDTAAPTAQTSLQSGTIAFVNFKIRGRILSAPAQQSSGVTISVQDTDGAAKSGLKVYAFDGARYTGISGTTDANGQATFTLPDGEYHFRADLNGTHFWSGSENHCTFPDCTTASVVVTKPLTVTVKSQTGMPYPNLKVYAFDGTRYTGFNGTTDTNGQVTLTLPQGNYHFRADYDGVQFWSSVENTCTLPGCESADVLLPGKKGEETVTIDYTYDPLYRLTAADYSTGDFYHYAYDAVGNRLTASDQSSVTSYQYDSANRLTTAGGQAYTFDANGNLLNDGANTYTYDSANRLIAVSNEQGTESSYRYNGLGDRLSQNGVNYTLDLNAGLTQVLSDGTTSYTYGLGRVSQTNTQTEYFLGDALGSVRQLVDANKDVTLAKSYAPYGEVLSSSGSGQTNYGYASEFTDTNGLIHLRARYYAPIHGRFFQQDPWDGDADIPATLNPYLYGLNNPILYTDPSGENPLAVILAVASVISGGAIAGGIYGCVSYEWALTGQCGCDLQQQATSMSKADWVTMHMLFGGFTAGVASILIAGATVAPWAAVAVGGLAVGYAVWDGINLINVVYQEKVGWTPCNITRAAIDLSIAIFGTANLISGLRGFRASGSWLRWTPEAGGIIRPQYSGPPKGWSNLKPSDLQSGYNGTLLQNAITSGDYRPPSNLIGGNPILRNTAKFIYVIDENGNILVTRNTGTFHHPDLVNGGNVYGAGEMFIDQIGQIVSITDQSGHYQPQGSMFFGYLGRLLHNLSIKVLPGALP